MKDTYLEDVDPYDVEDEEDLRRLDKGFTGLLAHWARAACIVFGCAIWPFLAWWVLLR